MKTNIEGVRRRHVLKLAAACGLAGWVPAHGAAAARRPRVALLMSDLGNPFFAAIARSFEQRFGSLRPGASKVAVYSAGFDHTRQAEHMQQALRDGVDVIVVSPIDADLLQPWVQKAHHASVRVIAVDSAVPGADLTVTTDNLAAGRIACTRMVDRLNGRGNVAIIHGPTNTAALERVRGCREVLEQNPFVRLVSELYNGGGTKEGGLERMVSILLENPRVDGLFAINDPTALGAEQAARHAGRSEMRIFSVDGSDEVARRLRDKNSLIVATVAQDPSMMGRLAAEGAARLLDGQPIVDPVVRLAPRLVTADNAATYQGWRR